MRANVLLLVIILKSILTSIISTILAVVRLFYYILNEKASNNTLLHFALWHNLYDLMSEIDYATNFFVFFHYGKKFRETCKHVVNKRLKALLPDSFRRIQGIWL